MQLKCICCAITGIVVAQGVVAGPPLANAQTMGTSNPVAVPRLSPLTVVAVYGLANPSVLCAATAATTTMQRQTAVENPVRNENSVLATPQSATPASPECVLPVVDQAANPGTPPATSEVAPLLALGPILAAAGIAGTAAAITSGDDDGDIAGSPD